MRTNVICAVLLLFVGGVDLHAQPAAATRAICLIQVGNADHAIFPLAISDSEAGVKWCQQKVGLPLRVAPPEVVSSAIMEQFLVLLRTVTGVEEKIPAGSTAYKFLVLQAEGTREVILDRPTAHNLVKRFEQICRGTRLHEDLAYIERQLRRPRTS